MRAAIICFTEKGSRLAVRAGNALKQAGWEISIDIKSKYAQEKGAEQISIYRGSLQEWADSHFADCQLLVFVGAAGIAVRAIAPFVRDKRKDPAVLVMDEKGTFVIPLLSGHIGGANEMAEYLGERLGAMPVLTTATDVNGRFAVDVFAGKNGLWISDMKLAKEVSAALLHGKEVLVTSDEDREETLGACIWPRGLVFQKREQAQEELKASPPQETVRIHLGVQRQSWLPPKTLYLVPRAVVVGIGCKKNTTCGAIRKHVSEVLDKNGIFPQAVSDVATIDLKAQEAGLLEFVREWGLDLHIFSADILKTVPGTYCGSPFVNSVTGVDNVCERSARLAGGMGPLIAAKEGRNGVTAACAVKDWSVEIEE